jgi:ankyrin repeat protein
MPFTYTYRFPVALGTVSLVVLLSLAALVQAETKTIISEATYSMGEGETPSFAEAIVLQKAKQRALEETGTYVESYTKVRNLDLTENEIQTIAGGVLQVEVLEKKRSTVGESFQFFIKIKATVTTDKMEDLAQRIRGKNVAQEYKNLQGEYARLSRELETWKQVASEAPMGAKRQTALDRIKESEKDFARVQMNEATLFRRLEADALLLDRIKEMDVQGVIQALKDGANPNAVDNLAESNKRKLSALGTLAFYGTASPSGSEETTIAIANALFGHGAKLSNIYDNNILFFPISEGWAKFTELLIQNGANPREKLEGQSPMEWAIHYNQPKVVEILKAHGIPSIDTEKSALLRFIAAAERADINEMNHLAQEERVYVNAKDDRDQTALIVALRHPIYREQQYRTIKLLLELGADPNVTGESLMTGLEGIPIHLVVAMNLHTLNKPSGDSRRLATLVVKDLLKHGGKVAQRDSKGRTALHIAAMDDNMVAAEILVAHGATIMPRDNSGKTPLDYAESAAMINFLKSHGATELNH